MAQIIPERILSAPFEKEVMENECEEKKKHQVEYSSHYGAWIFECHIFGRDSFVLAG